MGFFHSFKSFELQENIEMVIEKKENQDSNISLDLEIEKLFFLK